MRCNLLGSLEVLTSGVPTTVAAPKLRTVTALLAINAGRAVSAPHLITELWEQDPPPSASTTLQTYIYHLRKLLPAGHDAVVTTESAGYRLRLDPTEVDVFGLETRLAAGRRALRDHQVDDALGSLRSAEALWRGDPFADVPTGPALGAEAVRLHEVHMQIVELRIDAELRAGDHRALVPELRGLTGRHPLHEDFRAKLMLALFRSGRVSEALSVYAEFRGLLVDELGLEPSAALRDLHAGLLTGTDPSPPGVRVVTPGPPVAGAVAGADGRETEPAPHQLPADPDLVGRDDLVARATSALPGVLSVVGEPGVGTSALGLRVGHAVAARFPDAALHADLRARDGVPAAPEEVLADLLDAVGQPPEEPRPSTSRLARRFRSWCTGRRVLLVLDDARDADQVLPLLPGAGDHGVVVTSSMPLVGLPADRTVLVPPLDRADALRLLTADRGPDPDPDGREPLAAVADACGGLPLVLRAAAHRRLLLGDADLARRLARPEDGLAALVCPNRGLVGRARLRERIRALDETSAITLYLLGARLRGPFEVGEVVRELGVDRAAAEDVVDVLLDAHLLHAGGRDGAERTIRVNPVVAHHALELLGSPDGAP